MVCEPFLPLYMEIFRNPKLQELYLSSKRTKQTSPPSVLYSPSWRSYPPFLHGPSVKGTSTWFWDLNLSSSSSVSTFSNTINSHLGGDHYFNVKMHFDTKAFSTEAIGRKKQFKNPPKSLSCACAIAKSFCHEKNVHGLISSGSKKALFSAGIKVMVVVVGHGGAVVFTFL